jgi:hypothetical protein
MGIIGDTPQYPVVDRAPTVATVGASPPEPHRAALSPTPRSPVFPSSRPSADRHTRTDEPPIATTRPDRRSLSRFVATDFFGFARAVANFNATDYRDWACLTAASLPVGYMSGALSGPSVRVPAMVTGGIIGGLGGLMWAMQSSSGRLMGFLPNDAEAKRAR